MNPVAICTVAATLLFGATALVGNLGDYLPQDKFEGHFMRVAYPPRAAELFKKMQASLSKNKEWLAETMKTVKPGEPLPYDEKLGLTPAEYKEFLNLSKQAALKEVLAREIRVIHNNDGTIILDAGGDLKALSALKFDIVHNAVITPWCELDHPMAVDKSGKGEGGVFGPHTGLEFHVEGGDPGSTIDNPSGKAVTVTMGKITNAKKHFIAYNVIVMENGERTAGIDMILEY